MKVIAPNRAARRPIFLEKGENPGKHSFLGHIWVIPCSLFTSKPIPVVYGSYTIQSVPPSYGIKVFIAMALLHKRYNEFHMSFFAVNKQLSMDTNQFNSTKRFDSSWYCIAICRAQIACLFNYRRNYTNIATKVRKYLINEETAETLGTFLRIKRTWTKLKDLFHCSPSRK